MLGVPLMPSVPPMETLAYTRVHHAHTHDMRIRTRSAHAAHTCMHKPRHDGTDMQECQAGDASWKSWGSEWGMPALSGTCEKTPGCCTRASRCVPCISLSPQVRLRSEPDALSPSHSQP